MRNPFKLYRSSLFSHVHKTIRLKYFKLFIYALKLAKNEDPLGSWDEREIFLWS